VPIGATLAQARQQAGLTVAEVSARTRIREPIIRSIEDGDYAVCGGDFYARGNIRSIAKAVGTDAEPLIREYDSVHRARDASGAVSLEELLATSAQAPRRQERRAAAQERKVAAAERKADAGERRAAAQERRKAAAQQKMAAARKWVAAAGERMAAARGPMAAAVASVRRWPSAVAEFVVLAWTTARLWLSRTALWTAVAPTVTRMRHRLGRSAAWELMAAAVMTVRLRISRSRLRGPGGSRRDGQPRPRSAGPGRSGPAGPGRSGAAGGAGQSRSGPGWRGLPAVRAAAASAYPVVRRHRYWAVALAAALVVLGFGMYWWVAGSTHAAAAPAAAGRHAVTGQHARQKPAAGTGPPAAAPSPAAALPAQLLTPVSAAAFGPGGGDNPQLARLVIGGHRSAGWHTDWYSSARFGNLYPGTGLLLDMGHPVTLTAVRITLGSAHGASLQLRVGAAPALPALPPVAQISGAGGVVHLRLARPAHGRYVLIWFTRLPRDPAGTFQAGVYHVRLQGRS
jgi:Helix-turn-helix domain